MSPCEKPVVTGCESGPWENIPSRTVINTDSSAAAVISQEAQSPQLCARNSGQKADTSELMNSDSVKWIKGYTPNLICHCFLVLSKGNASQMKSPYPFTSQIQAGQDTPANTGKPFLTPCNESKWRACYSKGDTLGKMQGEWPLLTKGKRGVAESGI